MRNSCKAGGTAKKKYRIGGGTTDPPTKKVRMSPAKIAVGPVKPPTAKEKEEALKKFKAAMEKEVGKAPFPAVPPKKETGGYVEPKRIRKYYEDASGAQASIKKQRLDGSSIRRTYNYDPQTGKANQVKTIKQDNYADWDPATERVKTKSISPEKFRRKSKKIINKIGQSPMDRYESDTPPVPTSMKKGGSTKKKYEAGGGVIPSKPVMTAPMQGRLGNRPVAGGNMAKGGSLKDIPAGNKGLPNLPMPVRNNMGYKKKGGSVKKKK